MIVKAYNRGIRINKDLWDAVIKRLPIYDEEEFEHELAMELGADFTNESEIVNAAEEKALYSAAETVLTKRLSPV